LLSAERYGRRTVRMANEMIETRTANSSRESEPDAKMMRANPTNSSSVAQGM
jgi:hypothetical protein